MTQLVPGYNFWWRRSRLPLWSCMVGLNALHVLQLKALFPQGSPDQMCQLRKCTLLLFTHPCSCDWKLQFISVAWTRLLMQTCGLVMMSMCQQVFWAPSTDSFHQAWAVRMSEMLNTAVQSCITDVVLSVEDGSPPFDPSTAALCLNNTFNANSLPARGAAFDQYAEYQIKGLGLT